MDYNTTGSSNSATNGSNLELEIKISLPDPLKNQILLMGVFSVDNLNTLTKDLKELTCTLYGKTDDLQLNKTTAIHIGKLNYNDISPGNQSLTLNRNFNTAFSYLILKINTGTCTIKGPVANLSISFKDKNNRDENKQSILNTLSFAVQNVKDQPQILEFEADLTVLQGNDKPVQLSWKVKGENYTYTLCDGLEKLHSGTDEDTKNSFTIDPVPIGDHSYTLEVKQGGITVTKSKVVRALDESRLFSKASPPKPDVIANFCVSNNSDYLFSIVLKEKDNTASLDYIGFTNEGFSGKWSRFELTLNDKEKLKPFVTSPMVHLRDAGEFYGRLLFIGGSYVKPMECSNRVAIVYLDSDLGLDEETRLGTVTGVRVVVQESSPWKPRMGHCCVTFPHGNDGEEKIWLLGGYEFGNALNDIWVSGDGKKWNNVNAAGSANNTEVAAEMPWDERCLAGASVQLNADGTKKALWIAGGFSEMAGAETADIWKWGDRPSKALKGGPNTSSQPHPQLQWSEIPLKVNGGSYLSSGLAFAGIDSLQSTGMYVLGGGYKRDVSDNLLKGSYFNKIEDLGPSQYEYSILGFSKLDPNHPFSTTKNAYVVTGYFKGALWFMVFTNAADVGITYSRLFYWIPQVTGQTLLL